MKRIFSVRVNVDDIAASVGVLFTEQEKSFWLQGFLYALQGGAMRTGMPPSFDSGFLVGHASWGAARIHQEVSAKGGKLSIERHPQNSIIRQVPSGAPSEGPSDGGREQSLIVNPVIYNLQSTNDNPKIEREREALRPPRHPKNIIPPTKAMVEAYCEERNNSIDADKFLNRYEANGWLVGKSKMKDWQAAIRTWEGNGPIKPKEDHYGEEGDSLPTNLSDLPDGHPLKPIKKKAQAAP